MPFDGHPHDGRVRALLQGCRAAGGLDIVHRARKHPVDCSVRKSVRDRAGDEAPAEALNETAKA
jgi:hypothetical protein